MPEEAVGLWLKSEPGGLPRLGEGSRAVSKPAVVQEWHSTSREFAFQYFLRWKMGWEWTGRTTEVCLKQH